MILLLAWLAGCGLTSPAPPPEVSEPEASCVTWDVGPVQVSPVAKAARHHPTAAWLGDELLITWQVGKQPAGIGARRLDGRLVPMGREETISVGRDSRFTHPQIATSADGAWFIWSRDDDASVHARAFSAELAPTGPPTAIRQPGDAPPPARYPDMSIGADGVPWAVWFDDTPDAPGWTLIRLGEGAPTFYPLPVLEGSNAGGPATLAHAPDGTLWVVWPERAAADVGGEARIRATVVGEDGPGEPVTLHSSPDNDQRTVLTFAGDRLVTGWTRYPSQGSDWGVTLGLFAADGSTLQPPRSLDAGGGRMLDVDAIDGVVIAAWEAPGAGEDNRDLWLQRLGADLTPACAPERVHPPHADDQARAEVTLRQVGDVIEGVVIWQSGPNGREQAVWARHFTVPASPVQPLPEPVVAEPAEE